MRYDAAYPVMHPSTNPVGRKHRANSSIGEPSRRPYLRRKACLARPLADGSNAVCIGLSGGCACRPGGRGHGAGVCRRTKALGKVGLA